ncbi:MAG: nucleotidyltransferase family protein [Pseudomonadota bacterium]
MIHDIELFIVTPTMSVVDVMACVDRNGRGIALVVDEDQHLLGTVTDGDLRRAVLKGFNLNGGVSGLLKTPGIQMVDEPTTASVDTSESELLRIMREKSIRQIPIVDKENHVLGLSVWNDLAVEQEAEITVMIMAGGFGERLRPLTIDVPKPMLPVGDRPILERTVRRLMQSGIRQVNLSTHYKKDVIEGHFGDGSRFGLKISYVPEDEPLGTAGALCMIDHGNKPVLLINGDILTSVDFRAMLDFHREYGADLTVAVKDYEIEVPYGVVETEGVLIKGLSEKPVIRHFINAGIYIVEPTVCEFVPRGKQYDMTDLIESILLRGYKVVSFPIREYWMDIGHMDNYRQAQIDDEERCLEDNLAGTESD